MNCPNGAKYSGMASTAHSSLGSSRLAHIVCSADKKASARTVLPIFCLCQEEEVEGEGKMRWSTLLLPSLPHPPLPDRDETMRVGEMHSRGRGRDKSTKIGHEKE
jgi:hypothetical protein